MLEARKQINRPQLVNKSANINIKDRRNNSDMLHGIKKKTISSRHFDVVKRRTEKKNFSRNKIGLTY